MSDRARSYLEEIAPLSNFWIYKGPSIIGSGLLHVLEPDGQNYVVMGQDDQLNDEVIAFLISIDCPVFSDIESMDEYSRTLKLRLFPSA